MRGVAFEYRHKRAEERWQTNWEHAIFWTSLLPALLWGVAFANIVRGVKIDAHKEYVGTFCDLLNPYALLGGLVTLTLFTFHGAVFAALKTVGDIRDAGPRRWPLEAGAGHGRAGARLPDLDPGSTAATARAWSRWSSPWWRWSARSVAIKAGREGWSFALSGRDHRGRGRDALPDALPERHAVLAQRRRGA